ncbi:hypothetical protein PIB30_022132 [Stylosanthes scabra]|uniref:Proliferating cell nuclear antigen PCNA C-terminal domain-containing protein n=1 Tax=Stylosanthes scabra TaxID=79078 RepID=A0ABU6UA41_9FABA|nr:hypothetical protein [Stylosanthes scabra]
MNIASEHFQILEVEYNATVKMPSAEFARICGELSIFCNNVVISVTKEEVKFSTESHPWNYCIHSLPKESTAILMPMPKLELEPVSLTFAMRYMNSFTKATLLSNQVTIGLLNNG